jgi:hypothetical protein
MIFKNQKEICSHRSCHCPGCGSLPPGRIGRVPGSSAESPASAAKPGARGHLRRAKGGRPRGAVAAPGRVRKGLCPDRRSGRGGRRLPQARMPDGQGRGLGIFIRFRARRASARGTGAPEAGAGGRRVGGWVASGEMMKLAEKPEGERERGPGTGRRESRGEGMTVRGAERPRGRGGEGLSEIVWLRQHAAGSSTCLKS